MQAELVLGFLIVIGGPPLLWWVTRNDAAWPPEYSVASPRLRRLYRHAAHLFMATIILHALARLAEHFAILSAGQARAAGIVVAVPFFGSALPLIWYRLTRRLPPP